MRRLLPLCFLLLSACYGEGYISRTTADARSGARFVDILVATSRSPEETRHEFGRLRNLKTGFASYTVSIPPNHAPGEIEWPTAQSTNPAKAFFTSASNNYESRTAFRREMNARLARQKISGRGVFLFVHGYNNSFAEGLYSTAQLHTDYENPLVPVHFSWPSAGHTGLYAYDQDSALFARDALAELLADIASSRARNVQIVAHSMGGLVLMEALRLLTPAERKRIGSKMGNITLLSPDLDLDVFEAQVAKATPLPRPFYILISEKDFILKLSTLLRGGSRRLGLRVEDFARLRMLGVTPVDISDFANGQDFDHQTFNNPDLISVIVKLAQNRRGNPLDINGIIAAAEARR